MQDQFLLTTEQAVQLSSQCEFSARMHLGQFTELPLRVLDIRKLGSYEFCRRREEAETLLLAARKLIFPGLGAPGHSNGIGGFDEADFAFDIHQVLRTFLGDNRMPFSCHVLPKAWRCIVDGQDNMVLKLEPEHVSVLEKIKEFCEKTESGDYRVIIDSFADPEITTESGREEAKKILGEVEALVH